MAMAMILIFIILTFGIFAASQDINFTFNGFQSANLFLDNMAQVTSNGLLELTNESSDQQQGHAFYPNPITFKNQSINVSSFSATFVFAMVSKLGNLGGHGIAFVLSPTRGILGAGARDNLGLFNDSNNGNSTNHILAIEFDSNQSPDLQDMNKNHVGIDINSLVSEIAESAGYFDDNDGKLRILTLLSGQPMQAWVEYDGFKKEINVTMATLEMNKPKTPLLSLRRDLSSVIKDVMYVGFSSSTGGVPTSQYILGWSFSVNGEAQKLDISKLPELPPRGEERSLFLTIGLPLICVFSALIVVSGVIYFIRRRRKFAEILEDWELEYGPQRFEFKDLYVATKGFREKELLGIGGFGQVYKGVLSNSKLEVAVKKISHESKQGMKEFVAEIVSIGRLRHRNLVQLLGYCRRKGELILVYDYMPNGSLDKYLYDKPETTLDWEQRFRIIKGVASGLFYLHEEWEQVVIHRDVKASNVMLDAEFNPRLGDFGLAKLHDHGTDPQTTHVVAGTLGYLAPEQMRTGKATTKTDVYAFGAFLLEVACGKRPINFQEGKEFILIEWVFSCFTNGDILQTADPILGRDYKAQEMELILKLGLICCHSSPTIRPSMRQIVQYLEGDMPLPELIVRGFRHYDSGLSFGNGSDGGGDGNSLGLQIGDFAMSSPFLVEQSLTNSSHVAVGESILAEGR